MNSRKFLKTIADKVRLLRAKYASCGPIALQLERLTLTQLVQFIRVCHDKYQRSIIEPGTAVGALAAQVIIEIEIVDYIIINKLLDVEVYFFWEEYFCNGMMCIDPKKLYIINLKWLINAWMLCWKFCTNQSKYRGLLTVVQKKTLDKRYT